ncbi:hypothetical protein OV450_7269 [Actinobacteria bacterium OV450]|nr:hypothetical protein OV450_7269 [Actinobacteria bacterium OV450]
MPLGGDSPPNGSRDPSRLPPARLQIGPGPDEQADDIGMAASRREVQCRTPLTVRPVHRSTLPQQPRYLNHVTVVG